MTGAAPWDRLRTGLAPGTASLVAAATGLVAGIAGLVAGSLVLVNLYGPFGERRLLGLLATVAVAGVVGPASGLAAGWLARRSAAALLVAGLVAAAAVVVLFPARIDVHESFVPQPNPRSACRGWEFSHYTPGVMDGSATAYCIGLESPLPAG